MSDPGALVGLLAEDERVRALAAIVLGATSAAEVAEVSGLDPRAAVAALERLAAGGLVVQEPGGGLRSALTERCKELARELAAKRAADQPEEVFESVAPEAATVLRNFVKGGRLVSIPTQRTKRLAVLDWLAVRFEPGKVYPERDVNFILGQVHADVAALRRYLVDEEFLERRDGFYWRAGGTFEID